MQRFAPASPDPPQDEYPIPWKADVWRTRGPRPTPLVSLRLPWTPERIKFSMHRKQDGFTIAKIAEMLGTTPKSVWHVLWRVKHGPPIGQPAETFWTEHPEAVELVKGLWPTLKSCQQIADIINKRLGIDADAAGRCTKNMVLGKGHRLNLGPKETSPKLKGNRR